MRHSIAHDLPMDTARRATQAAMDSYGEQMAEYAPSSRWTSANHAIVQFTVAGRTLEGAVTVKPRSVDLQLDVPFLFRPFKGVAMRIVKGEIEAWLARARAGEFDE